MSAVVDVMLSRHLLRRDALVDRTSIFNKRRVTPKQSPIQHVPANPNMYAHLVGAIIRKFIVMLGSERALRIARTVPGLEVDSDGEVISCAGLETLADLAAAFRGAGGVLAVQFMKNAIRPLIEGRDVVLPEQLK